MQKYFYYMLKKLHHNALPSGVTFIIQTLSYLLVPVLARAGSEVQNEPSSIFLGHLLITQCWEMRLRFN